MNDETPRRYRGSLLERAAERYDLMHEPRVIPPVPAAEPARVPPDPVALEAEHELASEPTAPRPNPAEAAPAEETIAEEVVAEPAAVEAPASPLVCPAPRVRAPSRDAFITIDRDRLAEEGMLVPGATVTALAEEFRLIKRQLLNTARAVWAADSDANENRARMILVCSAKPNDGKTFCAINLALSMAAEKDVEVLLVDADFAKPDVMARLGASEGPGLLDVLAGDIDNVESCVIATDVPQLSVLPAGTRSNADTELLASERAARILESLAAADPRRIVIFDSPPALAASPASVLAGQVGQVMLVVRADRTSESDLREAVGLLDGCDQIQLVLNSVSFQPGGRRFGSYGAYYGEAES
ncbi:AAA family ATPase [Sphingomonas sp.]|uniref:AAA family ATPase n=1 Tax=Sphingomonas sp. TaxID=28214 RepID=UPI002ED9A6A3